MTRSHYKAAKRQKELAKKKKKEEKQQRKLEKKNDQSGESMEASLGQTRNDSDEKPGEE